MVSDLFDPTLMMPHGHCYLWKPGLMLLHASTDLVIGLSYVAISVMLYVLVRSIRLPFSPVLLAFGVFIGACGATHFMEVWNLWQPQYWLAGGVKLVTAAASFATALFVIPIRPRVVKVASEAALSEARRIQLEAKTMELERLNEQVKAQARDDLRLSEARFRGVFESAPVGIAIVNFDGRWDRVNSKLCQIVGYSEQELATRTLADITHPDDLDADSALAAQLAAGQIPNYQLVKRYIRKDGVVVWVNLTAATFGEGAARRFLAIVDDISRRRALESEREQLLSEAVGAVAAREEFLQVAAHELKTPLTTLMLQIEATRRAVSAATIDADMVMARLATLKKQVTRLDKLNSQLLDVTRLGSARPELNPISGDFGEQLNETISRLHEVAVNSGCTVNASVANVPSSFDPLRFDQIATNLLINAFKYGPNKPVDVRLFREGEFAVLVIRDNGIGIEKEAQARLFRRFARAAPAENYGGLGLGLYITRELVEAMGGTIALESMPNEGTTVTVRLPIRA